MSELFSANSGKCFLFFLKKKDSPLCNHVIYLSSVMDYMIADYMTYDLRWLGHSERDGNADDTDFDGLKRILWPFGHLFLI